MTDEEMAYEYAKYDDNGRISVNDDKFKAFLAGLKASNEEAKDIINELLMNGYDENTRAKAFDFLYPNKEE